MLALLIYVRPLFFSWSLISTAISLCLTRSSLVRVAPIQALSFVLQPGIKPAYKLATSNKINYTWQKDLVKELAISWDDLTDRMNLIPTHDRWNWMWKYRLHPSSDFSSLISLGSSESIDKKEETIWHEWTIIFILKASSTAI